MSHPFLKKTGTTPEEAAQILGSAGVWDLAAKFEVESSTVYRWIKKFDAKPIYQCPKCRSTDLSNFIMDHHGKPNRGFCIPCTPPRIIKSRYAPEPVGPGIDFSIDWMKKPMSKKPQPLRNYWLQPVYEEA